MRTENNTKTENLSEKEFISKAYNLSVGNYNINSFYRIICDGPFVSRATHVVLLDCRNNQEILLIDMGNTDTIDQAIIKSSVFGDDTVLTGKEADLEFGAIFRNILDYVLENIMTSTHTGLDEENGIYLFIGGPIMLQK